MPASDSITPAPAPAPRVHLRALLLAALATGVMVWFAQPLLRPVERLYLRRLLAQPFPEKNQGVFLQREAFLLKDVMPIYGSSELTTPMDKRADEFFQHKPTGFQVCPVGAAGNHTLLTAQKIAAMGGAVKNRKIAVILSPSWFRGRPVPKDHVAGNFSPLQAIDLLQSKALPEELRARFLKRMLDYPEILEDHWLISEQVHAMTDPGGSQTRQMLLPPALAIYRRMLSCEDHLNTLAAILKYDVPMLKRWRHRPKNFPWRRVIRGLPDEDEDELPPVVPGGEQDQIYVRNMTNSPEWDDFALLLDTLRALQARALIISVPLPGASTDRRGVSRAARDYYYHRVAAMSRERGFPSATFSDHDLDLGFLVGSSSHLETKGWIFVDKLLDDFFHNRVHVPRPAPAQ